MESRHIPTSYVFPQYCAHSDYTHIFPLAESAKDTGQERRLTIYCNSLTMNSQPPSGGGGDPGMLSFLFVRAAVADRTKFSQEKEEKVENQEEKR